MARGKISARSDRHSSEKAGKGMRAQSRHTWEDRDGCGGRTGALSSSAPVDEGNFEQVWSAKQRLEARGSLSGEVDGFEDDVSGVLRTYHNPEDNSGMLSKRNVNTVDHADVPYWRQQRYDGDAQGTDTPYHRTEVAVLQPSPCPCPPMPDGRSVRWSTVTDTVLGDPEGGPDSPSRQRPVSRHLGNGKWQREVEAAHDRGAGCWPPGNEACELKECADVHWLNSLDGEACLLVDSYRDLSDGLAVEEAFTLAEGFTDSPSGTDPVDIIKNALAGVEKRRGRSAVPPRLLQPSFPHRVCEGDPCACGDLVKFLKSLHAADRKNRAPDTSTRATHSPLPKAGSPRREGAAHTPASSRGRKIRDTPVKSGPCGSVLTLPLATEMERKMPPPPAPPPPPPPPPPRQPKPRRSWTLPGKKPKSAEKAASGATVRASGRCTTAPVNLLRETPWGRRGDREGANRASRPAISAGLTASRETSLVAGHDHFGGEREREVAEQNAATRTAPAIARSLRPRAWEAGHGVAGRPREQGSEGCRRARQAPLAMKSGLAEGGRHGVPAAPGRGLVPGKAHKPRGEKATITPSGNITAAMIGGPGERRSERRRVLGWMERLGMKVDWSLLTPEEAPCHERLSSGELFCELAAAIDYAASGGRGLPLSELPSCPGRFVLRGTCGGPSNAARSRHNVRAALGAFKALGGIPGARLRSEEAILDGDHEATWGLLASVHTCYGRLRRRRVQRSTQLERPKAATALSQTPTTAESAAGSSNRSKTIDGVGPKVALGATAEVVTRRPPSAFRVVSKPPAGGKPPTTAGHFAVRDAHVAAITGPLASQPMDMHGHASAPKTAARVGSVRSAERPGRSTSRRFSSPEGCSSVFPADRAQAQASGPASAKSREEAPRNAPRTSKSPTHSGGLPRDKAATDIVRVPPELNVTDEEPESGKNVNASDTLRVRWCGDGGSSVDKMDCTMADFVPAVTTESREMSGGMDAPVVTVAQTIANTLESPAGAAAAAAKASSQTSRWLRWDPIGENKDIMWGRAPGESVTRVKAVGKYAGAPLDQPTANIGLGGQKAREQQEEEKYAHATFRCDQDASTPRPVGAFFGRALSPVEESRASSSADGARDNARDSHALAAPDERATSISDSAVARRPTTVAQSGISFDDFSFSVTSTSGAAATPVGGAQLSLGGLPPPHQTSRAAGILSDPFNRGPGTDLLPLGCIYSGNMQDAVC